MKIAVIGGGGREHAIIKKLRENPLAEKIYALPGNAGMEEAGDAECVNIRATDIGGIVDFAVANRIDYAVVTPDDPLVLGCADALTAAGIPCFGPTAAAAAIEGSKVFAKNLMKKYGIPTAAYEVFDSPGAALEYLKTARIPTVVKADGLALGKGVTVAFTREEAAEAVRSVMIDRKFGRSGERIVIEEYLEGPEVSVLALTDGETVIPLTSSMDHKRALDGDLGPNTGGMGTVAPNPYYTEEIAAVCREKIFLPTVRAMKKEGRTFKGCLYFGLMLTKDGPKVIEYNCRFGDPETQVVLPLLRSDLLDLMLAVSEGRLSEKKVEFYPGCAACVIVASGGYPGSYGRGYPMTVPENPGATLYFAGVARENGRLVTSGGRVVGVASAAKTLPDALEAAYRAAEKIGFKDSYMRRDIGKRALEAGR